MVQQDDNTGNGMLAKFGSRQVAVGAIVVLLLLAGAGIAYKFLQPTVTTQAVQEPEIGVMDMQKVFMAHSDYAKLESLKKEAKVLEDNLHIQHMTLEVQAPKADAAGFDEAAKQKSHLARIAMFEKAMTEFKNIEKQKLEELKPVFDSEKNAIDNEYQTEILNIKLKIDNAEILGLTAENIASMKDRMQVLQKERGDRQMALKKEQDARLQAAVDAATGGKRQQVIKEMQADKAEYKSEALQKQIAAQNRNSEAVSAAMTPIQLQFSMTRKQAALTAKKQEISILEKHIFKDIAGRASKLAVIHHLTLILANPADNLKGMTFEMFQTGKWTERRTPVIGVNTIDLTDEMLEEMKSL